MGVLARWLHEVEDPRTLGVLRIGIGLLLVGNVAALWPHADYLYGVDGLLPAREYCGSWPRNASLLCYADGASNGRTVLAMTCLSATMFALGIGTHVSKWLTAFLFATVVLRNSVMFAGDQVFGNFLFLLCLSRCGEAYSFDRWLQRRRAGPTPYPHVPAWPRRLMMLQVCFVFGVNGWAKTGITYQDGTALYYLLANERWFRFEPWWLLSTFGSDLLRVATWVAWWFERLFPLAVLGLIVRRLWPGIPAKMAWPVDPRLALGLACVFSGTLVVFANIGWFVPASAVATLCLFRGEQLGVAVDRILRRSPTPLPPTRPSEVPVRARTAVLAVFIGFHSVAMTEAATRPFHEPATGTVGKLLSGWRSVTNTRQHWAMFAPNAPRVQTRLRIEARMSDGSVGRPYDDDAMIAARAYPYVGLNRRQKAHSKIAKSKTWRPAHARHVCRTFRDVDGESPREVLIYQERRPFPPPGRMAELGAIDPRTLADQNTQRLLVCSWKCGSGGC